MKALNNQELDVISGGVQVDCVQVPSASEVIVGTLALGCVVVGLPVLAYYYLPPKTFIVGVAVTAAFAVCLAVGSSS